MYVIEIPALEAVLVPSIVASIVTAQDLLGILGYSITSNLKE